MLKIIIQVAALATCATAQADLVELTRLAPTPAVHGSFQSGKLNVEGLFRRHSGLGPESFAMQHHVSAPGGLLEIAVLPNDGCGGWGETRVVLTTPYRQDPYARHGQATWADFNGDERTDLYIPHGRSASSVPDPLANSVLFLCRADGVLEVAPRHFLPATNFSDMHALAVDVDADGDMDLVLGCFIDPAYASTYRRNALLLNDGTGRFTHSVGALPGDMEDTVYLGAIDADGDGDMDILCGNEYFWSPGSMRIYINDGTGRFSTGQEFTGFHGPLADIADIDGDGDLDILTMDYRSRVPAEIWRNDGSGHFTMDPQALPAAFANSAASGHFGDIDEDGDPDIVIPALDPNPTAEGYQLVRQWINDGTGRFHDLTPPDMLRIGGTVLGRGPSVAYIALEDFDNDGDLDVLIGDTVPIFPPNRDIIGWNLKRHIYAPAPARIGSSWTVDIHGDPGLLAIPVASFGFQQTRIPGVGMFGLEPTGAAMGPGQTIPADGKASVTFPIPRNLSLVGIDIFWQGALVDLSTNRARFTNTFRETFEN